MTKNESRVREHSLAEEMPYEEIFDNTMIYRDGSLGMCYLLNPVYIDSLDDGGKAHVVRVLSGALNSLERGMFAQILWRKDLTTPIIDLHKEQIVSGDPLIHIMSEDRCLFWDKMVRRKEAFGITCELWLRRFYPRTIRDFGSIWNTGRDATQIIRKYVAEHNQLMSSFTDVCAKVVSPIQSFTGVRQANADEMMQSIWRYACGDFDSPGYSSLKPLRMHFGGIDVARKWGYLSTGNQNERQVAILSCDALPQVSYLSMINYLLTLPMPMTVVMNIAPVAMNQAKVHLRKTLKRYETFLFKRDPECEEKAGEIFNLLQDLESSSNQLFDIELYTILEGKSLDDLKQRMNTVSSIMQSDMDITMRQEKAALFLAYKAAMPGACVVGTTDRHFRIKSENVADLAPILGPMKSADRPVALMKAPYQGIYGYDLFDSRLPAAHGLIFGATGAGKSFTTTLLLLSFMSQNPLVFIIDKGRSYQKLTKMLNGAYIDLADEAISFNPLEGKDCWQDRQQIISLMFQEMLRDEPGKPVDKLMQTIIERLIIGLYTSFEKQKVEREPTLSDAYALLQKKKLYDPDSEAMLKPLQDRAMVCLGKWCRTGTHGMSLYSRILDNAKTRVSMDNDFICFDLQGIEQYKDLMNVVFLVLNDLIKRKVVKNGQQHKIIVFDEVWSLLKTEEGAMFLEELYRTMRKYQCMVLSISQDVEDFSNSSVANALMTNTYQTFILRQANDSNADKIQQILKLNDSERQIVSGLRQKKGFFSEMFLRIAGVGSGKVALVPSPVEYWMATTDPEDKKLLANYLDRGVTLENAIVELSKNYPNGVSGTMRG